MVVRSVAIMKAFDMNSPNVVVQGGVLWCLRLCLSPGVSLECLHFMILTRGGSESELGQGKVNL